MIITTTILSTKGIRDVFRLNGTSTIKSKSRDQTFLWRFQALLLHRGPLNLLPSRRSDLQWDEWDHHQDLDVVPPTHGPGSLLNLESCSRRRGSFCKTLCRDEGRGPGTLARSTRETVCETGTVVGTVPAPTVPMTHTILGQLELVERHWHSSFPTSIQTPKGSWWLLFNTSILFEKSWYWLIFVYLKRWSPRLRFS